MYKRCNNELPLSFAIIVAENNVINARRYLFTRRAARLAYTACAGHRVFHTTADRGVNMEHISNRVTLRGSLHTAPEFSHENHGIAFYRLVLEVTRLSGVCDYLPVVASCELLGRTCVSDGDRVLVTGQLRSYHNAASAHQKLKIFVFAEEMEVDWGEPCNEVILTGSIRKEPVFRRTPLGREICDVMLSVARSYKRTDYIPCIFWGRTARELALCSVGQRVTLRGRFQSRQYKKATEEGILTRTAYEVSTLTMERIEEHTEPL